MMTCVDVILITIIIVTPIYGCVIIMILCFDVILPTTIIITPVGGRVIVMIIILPCVPTTAAVMIIIFIILIIITICYCDETVWDICRCFGIVIISLFCVAL